MNVCVWILGTYAADLTIFEDDVRSSEARDSWRSGDTRLRKLGDREFHISPGLVLSHRRLQRLHLVTSFIRIAPIVSVGKPSLDMTSVFNVIEHSIPGQHIREYPNGTKYRQEDTL